ncbi:MAG: hypothetical protein ACRDYC_00155, partial [Acidimicrobiales bacterium]
LMQVAEASRIDLARLRAAAAEKARAAAGGKSGGGWSRGGATRSGLSGSSGARSDVGGGRSESAGSRSDLAGGRSDRSLDRVSDGALTGVTVAAVPVAAVELDVLRLVVHRPEDVPDSLEALLFDHALARSAFQRLAASATLHDAMEGADPQTAQLIARLAVDEPGAEAGDVVLRLLERAGGRALTEVREQFRHATLQEQAELFQSMAWLKHTLESLRAEGGGENRESQEALVAWLAERGRFASGGEDR